MCSVADAPVADCLESGASEDGTSLRPGAPDDALPAAHLDGRVGPSFILTFEEVEAIVGGPLPLAGRELPHWWSGGAIGKVCRNLKSDDDNCGRCGKRCGENETCEAGNCKCPGPRCGPLQDICCRFAASSGGNCCPTSVKPKCCGGTHSVCQEDGCCPAGFYSCLDGQRCCPRGTICTGTDRCKNPSRSPDAAESTSAAAALRGGG